MTSGNNARGNPVRDETFDAAAKATTGKWVDIRGCLGYNIMIVSAPVAAAVATWTVDASFDGLTNHGQIQAALSVDDPDANVNMNEPVPYIRLVSSSFISGSTAAVYLYGVPHS